LSAINDFADLFVASSEYVGRADFAHLFPRFVALAEDRLSKALRTEAQEVRVTLTADSQGRVTLPADFREPRSIYLTGSPGRALSGGSLSALDALYPNAGTPEAFSIGGGYLYLRPSAASSVTLTYYSGVPRLTSAAPTNTLLTRYSDCYLYGVIFEILVWARDAEGATLVKSMLDDAIMEATSDDQRRRFSLMQVRMTGVTP
jgi:hypothetical protein